MNARTVKWRTLWRVLLCLQITLGASVSLILAFVPRADSAPWQFLWITGAVLLLASQNEEQRERIVKLERRQQYRDKTEGHATAVISDLMSSAHRLDPQYREDRARRKRIDDAMKEWVK